MRRLLRSRRSRLLETNGRIGRLATGVTSRVVLVVMGSLRGTGVRVRAMAVLEAMAARVQAMGAIRRTAEMGVIRRVVLVVMAMRVRAMVALAEMAVLVQGTGETRRVAAMGVIRRVVLVGMGSRRGTGATRKTAEIVRAVVTSRVVLGAMAILVVTGSLRAMKVQAARAATRKTETVRPTATPPARRRHRRLLLR